MASTAAKASIAPAGGTFRADGAYLRLFFRQFRGHCRGYGEIRRHDLHSTKQRAEQPWRPGGRVSMRRPARSAARNAFPEKIAALGD